MEAEHFLLSFVGWARVPVQNWFAFSTYSKLIKRKIKWLLRSPGMLGEILAPAKSILKLPLLSGEVGFHPEMLYEL